jgi:transposase
MISTNSVKTLTEILNLDSVKVVSYHQHEGIGIFFQVDSLEQESVCPRCGTKSHKLHQNHPHVIKDLPISGQAVYLEINRRQLKCDVCKKP